MAGESEEAIADECILQVRRRVVLYIPLYTVLCMSSQ